MFETYKSSIEYIRAAAEKGYFDASTMRFLWTEHTVFTVVMFVYAGAALFYFLHVFYPKSPFGKATGWIATSLITINVLTQITMFVWRASISGRGPFQSLYEALLWFAFMIGIVYLYVENRLKMRMSGILVSLMLFGSIKFAMTREPFISPWFPPNQSYWFLIHIISAFTSYAVFMVGFANEISYLILSRISWLNLGRAFGYNKETIPKIREMTWKLIRFGFPLLTLTIFGGAVWANDTWGRYWSWDPKEVWAAITWVFYAFYIHAMAHPRWRGSRASVLVVLAFVAMIITFIGISFLVKLFNLESFHAYAI